MLPLDEIAQAHRMSEAGTPARQDPAARLPAYALGAGADRTDAAAAPARTRPDDPQPCALPDGTPGPLAAEYYAQRAGLGLLITEGTQPSDDGQGYLDDTGHLPAEHVAGWRIVADAVHAEGGHLVIQLMHVGRMSHPDNTPHHRQPVAPSAIAPGVEMFTATGAAAASPSRGR